MEVAVEDENGQCAVSEVLAFVKGILRRQRSKLILVSCRL